MFDTLIIHYSEIAIKGNNRNFFEKKLVENIRQALGKKIKKSTRQYGRIVCELTEMSHSKASLEENLEREFSEKLKKIAGIASFSFGRGVSLTAKDSSTRKSFLKTQQKKQKNLNSQGLTPSPKGSSNGKLKKDLATLQKVALEIATNATVKLERSNQKFETFKVATSRSDKRFPKSSKELNEILGELLRLKLKKKVQLANPDLTLFLEVTEKTAYLYVYKHKGMGGLPVGSSAKLIVSLSGGIDSPVASYLMSKRGADLVFAHFMNDTLTSPQVLEKILQLTKLLAPFQTNTEGKTKLYLFPFASIQKAIIANVPSPFRMIIYRRFMLRVIALLAEQEKAKGVVTGDSLGQVASQTAENMGCIYQASSLPIFTPLIGMNKEEIIQLAHQIGTYQSSILPYPDCCSFMVAKHPKTKAQLAEILRLEEEIKNIEELVTKTFEKTKIKEF